MVSSLLVVMLFIEKIPIQEFERSYYNALLFSIESPLSQIYHLSCIQLHVQTSKPTNYQHQCAASATQSFKSLFPCPWSIHTSTFAYAADE
jgi:hypothetical protein